MLSTGWSEETGTILTHASASSVQNLQCRPYVSCLSSGLLPTARTARATSHSLNSNETISDNILSVSELMISRLWRAGSHYGCVHCAQFIITIRNIFTSKFFSHGWEIVYLCGNLPVANQARDHTSTATQFGRTSGQVHCISKPARAPETLYTMNCPLPHPNHLFIQRCHTDVSKSSKGTSIIGGDKKLQPIQYQQVLTRVGAQ